MLICKWDELPEDMQTDAVRPYYNALRRKNLSLLCKRIFDITVSAIMLILLSPLFVVLAVLIKADSRGSVFFRQARITQYGKVFRIFKFRTMVSDAEHIGAQVTSQNDVRITRVGKAIRKLRIDEIPQLLNIFVGDMSFVGTRPEVPKYVERYSDEMRATLLLPAGVTSEASIEFKDEDELMKDAENIDDTYVNEVLPRKMEYNLNALKHYGFFGDIRTMFRTVAAVLKR